MRLTQDRRGSAYIETAFTVLILFFLLFALLSTFSIFTSYLSLNAQAKQLAHGIEIYGQADETTIRLVSDNTLGADDVTISAAWFNAQRRTIQLKTPFTVTLTRQVNIPVLRFIGGTHVDIPVRISASASGISEVYWKAGS